MSHLFIAAPAASPQLLDDAIEALTAAGVPLSTTTLSDAFAITVIGEVSAELHDRILKEGAALPLYSLRESVPTPKGLLTPSAVFDLRKGLEPFTRYLWQRHSDELLGMAPPFFVVTSAEKRFADWVVRLLRERGVPVWYGDHLDWQSTIYDEALLAAIAQAEALVLPERPGLADDERVQRARKAAEAAMVDVRPYPMGDTRSASDETAAADAFVESLKPEQEMTAPPPGDDILFEDADTGDGAPPPQPSPVTPQPGMASYTVGDVNSPNGVIVIGENNRVTLIKPGEVTQYASQVRHFEAAFPVTAVLDETQMLRIAVRLPGVPSPFEGAEERGETTASDEGREVTFEVTPDGGYKPLPLRVDINAPGFEPHTDDASFTLHYEDDIAQTEVALLALKPGSRVIVVTVLTEDTALATMKLATEVVEERRAGLNFSLGIVRFSLAFGR
jgi:hypothetical protein